MVVTTLEGKEGNSVKRLLDGWPDYKEIILPGDSIVEADASGRVVEDFSASSGTKQPVCASVFFTEKILKGGFASEEEVVIICNYTYFYYYYSCLCNKQQEQG